jgi:hypothetical protein
MDESVLRQKLERFFFYVADGWDAPEWRAPWRSSTPAE